MALEVKAHTVVAADVHDFSSSKVNPFVTITIHIEGGGEIDLFMHHADEVAHLIGACHEAERLLLALATPAQVEENAQ